MAWSASVTERRRTMYTPKRAPPPVRPRVAVNVSSGGGGGGGGAGQWSDDLTLPTSSSATSDEEQSAMDMQFTLLPLAHSNHGAITGLCVWQHAVFIGTASGTLMRYDIDLYEDDLPNSSRHIGGAISSSSRPLVHPASARASSSTMPSFAASAGLGVGSGVGGLRHPSLSRFAVTRASQSGSLDVRRHHGRKSSSASAPIVSLVACPPVGVLCALAEGALCLYDLRTLAFRGRVSPPGGGAIDRFALFPPPRNSSGGGGGGSGGGQVDAQAHPHHFPSQRHRQRGAFSMLSLCVCAGKRMFILARSMDSTGADGSGGGGAAAAAGASSSSLAGAASEAAQWTLQHELAIPEAAHALEWIDAVHVLVGFARRKEYSVINTVTGGVVDLCGLDPAVGGEPVVHSLGGERTLLNVGRKSMLHCSSALSPGAGAGGGTSIGIGSRSFSGVEGRDRGASSGAGATASPDECDSDGDPPAHLLSDAMLYHRPPLALGSLPMHALVLDATHVHVYLKPGSGIASWRMVQNVPVVGAGAMWTDGAALALLAKGPQLYFLQPIHAADKQRDALLMWSVRSKFLCPNPAAPPGLLWTREEAETAVTTHVLQVFASTGAAALPASASSSVSSASGGNHPFAVMVAGFVRAFSRRVRTMIAASLAEEAAAAAAEAAELQQENESAAAAAAAAGSSSAAASSSPATPAAPSSAIYSSRPTRSRRSGRCGVGGSLRVAPVSLPLGLREELVQLVRDFSETMEMSMRVMWADCCGTTRASKEAQAAAQAAAKDKEKEKGKTKDASGAVHSRRASVLFSSSGAVSSTGGGAAAASSDAQGQGGADASAASSDGAAAAAAAPPSNFLPLCLSLFTDALFRALYPSLFPIYAALSRGDDERHGEAAALHRERHATMETFGSSILRKSPWLKAKFGARGDEAGAGSAAGAAAGAVNASASEAQAGAPGGPDGLAAPSSSSSLLLPKPSRPSGFGRSSSFSVNFLSSYRGASDPLPVPVPGPTAAAAAAAAQSDRSGGGLSISVSGASPPTATSGQSSSRLSRSPSPMPLLRKSATFHPLSPAPLPHLHVRVPSQQHSEDDGDAPSASPNSMLVQAFERTKLLPSPDTDTDTEGHVSSETSSASASPTAAAASAEGSDPLQLRPGRSSKLGVAEPRAAVPATAAAAAAGGGPTTGAWSQLPPSAPPSSSTSSSLRLVPSPPSALVLSTLLQDAYAPSISLLRMLPLLYSPDSKLRLLAKVHKQLLADSQKVYDPTYVPPSAGPDSSSSGNGGGGATGKKFTMSADDLVPILCFALLHARLDRPHAEGEMVADYLGAEQALGAEGYMLTTFQIALAQISAQQGSGAGVGPGMEGEEEEEKEAKEEAAVPHHTHGEQQQGGSGGGSGASNEPAQSARDRAASTTVQPSELLSSLTHYASYFPPIASPTSATSTDSSDSPSAIAAAAATTGASFPVADRPGGLIEEEEIASDGMIHAHSAFSTGASALFAGPDEPVVVSPLIALDNDYFSADRPALSTSTSFSNNHHHHSASAAPSMSATPAASPSRARPSSYAAAAAAAAAASSSAGNSPSPALHASTGPQRIGRHFGRAPSLSSLGMSLGSVSASSSPSFSRGLLLFGEGAAGGGGGSAADVACSPALLSRPSLSRSESLSMLSSSSAMLASSPMGQANAGIGSALLASAAVSAMQRRAAGLPVPVGSGGSDDPLSSSHTSSSHTSSVSCSPAPVAEEEAPLAVWHGHGHEQRDQDGAAAVAAAASAGGGLMGVELRPMSQGSALGATNPAGVGMALATSSSSPPAAASASASAVSGGHFLASSPRASSASVCVVPSSASWCGAAAATSNRISMLSPSSQLLLSSAQLQAGFAAKNTNNGAHANGATNNMGGR